MALRSVRRRAGWSRGPSVRRRRDGARIGSARRVNMAEGGRSRTREAASSIARGSPSSRRQSCATYLAFAPVRVNPGSTDRARATKSRIASYRSSSSAVASASIDPIQDTEWRHVELLFAGDAQRDATGRKQLETLTGREQLRQARPHIEHLLE